MKILTKSFKMNHVVKKNMVGIKYLDDNGFVHRLCTEETKAIILENYKQMVDKGVAHYLPSNIVFQKKEIIYKYVEGQTIDFCYNFKINKLYIQMLYDLYCHQCYVGDVSRANVIFHEGKLTIIDLDSPLFKTKREFVKACIQRFFWRMIHE